MGRAMNDEKFQLFISSTYDDLKDAREKVIKTILSNYHIPIGMEMFSAADEDQWSIIKDTIDISDYYIVIIGHRYGSMTPDGISFTEKEYDYATKSGIPIFAFIKDRNAPTIPKERDEELLKKEKLELFVNKVSGKMREFWSNADDLANKVSIALNKAIRRYERPGWVRANKAVSPEVVEELTRLSNENRELRKELSQMKVAVPMIEVFVNGESCLELKLKRLDPNPELFKRIEYSEIPKHLRQYIPLNDVEEYNKLVISKKEEIERYKKELVKYCRLVYNPDFLVVDVINNGNSSASEVIVEIFFPSAIVVLNRETKKEVKGPDEIPGLEKSPLRQAEKKFKKDNKNRSIISNFSLPRINLDNIVYRINSTEVDRVENKATLNIKKLLHTQKERFADDLFIVPLETGDFELKVSIICEEYRNKEEFKIPVKIVESDEDFFPKNSK
jgi:hypothetical protein